MLRIIWVGVYVHHSCWLSLEDLKHNETLETLIHNKKPHTLTFAAKSEERKKKHHVLSKELIVVLYLHIALMIKTLSLIFLH